MENQAWILRSFLAQLERLEALGEEALNDIAEEFARLKSESTKYRTDKTYLTKTAEKQENVKKNRYKDIVPFEHSRVKLNFTTSKNDTDYINASFIKGASGVKEYIATQGPLPHTVTDFLRMLWEYNIKVVVMACREFEMGKKKCELYWSPTQEPAFVSGPFTVHCDSEENKGHYLTRTLRVTYRNSSRTLKQLHYVTWPDHGVPDSIPSILEMLEEMRCYQAHDDVPICIHCSAGCGRTGVLCVIDYTWNLLKKQMITPDFNIYDLVKSMRTQRPSVVQTKEQYELVYRTIKLLFERYLQTVEAQARRNEVTLDPSTIVPGDESADLRQELDFLPQFQQILNKERDFLPHVLRDEDTQRDQQQWNNLQSLPDVPLTTQDLQEGPRTPPQCIELQIQEDEDIPSLNPPPSPTLAAAICQMVEDPYFDTPINSPSSEEAPADSSRGWTDFKVPSLSVDDQAVEPNSPASGPDEEIPPPLPQRTPESYVVVVDTGCPGPCDRLIIPTNITAEADRELGGCPPSPVPPLPERTPQSFELADSASGEQELKVNRSRIGTSSEWCGNSEPADAAPHPEKESFVRSRSLKAKMTFTVVPVAPPDPPLSSHLHPSCPPLDLLMPPLTSQAEESLAAHLPHRTRDSFVVTTEDAVHEEAALCSDHLQTTHPSPMVGSSSKWDDASRPKKFLDAVKSRSKSVRAKSQRPESLHTPQQLASVPVVTPEGGSAQVNSSHNPPLTAETSGNKSNKSTEKAMSRTMSLKIFRKKPKIAPPPPPAAQPRTPPAERASSSVFKFGFGNRFGKPKGPRRYPETWN